MVATPFGWQATACRKKRVPCMVGFLSDGVAPGLAFGVHGRLDPFISSHLDTGTLIPVVGSSASVQLSRGIAENFAGDDQPLDVAGALVDIEDAGVAERFFREMGLRK